MRNQDNKGEFLINVSGLSNTGKTSLTLIIQRMLIKQGFMVELNVIDNDLLNDNRKMLSERDSLNMTNKIVINEV